MIKTKCAKILNNETKGTIALEQAVVARAVLGKELEIAGHRTALSTINQCIHSQEQRASDKANYALQELKAERTLLEGDIAQLEIEIRMLEKGA